jgi:seryl-tRNA synthetase
MLSIDFIRENKQKVIEAAKNKNREVNVAKILSLDDERRQFIQQSQKLREERNVLAKQEFDESNRSRGKQIKEELKGIEDKLTLIEKELNGLLLTVPNIPLPEVPIGKDAGANVEIRKWGSVPAFDFSPKSHIELGKELDLIDFERGAKVSGFRGYFLKNEGAILQMAVLFYAFQELAKKGYTPLIAPSIVREFSLYGTGHFPWSREDVYQLNDSDTYLSGTAEVAVTSYFSNEILNEKDLPKKFVAFSPCFRKEAGAYGKDTRGLYRLHEFWKVEQVAAAKNDLKEALVLHEELEKNAEEILQALILPYRVMLMSTGEMGEPQIKKYDIETWMPSRNAYGETMSNSILGDFQARRLGLKYRNPDGKTEYCYTLNNTAIASPRILIPLLENHQQKDGSINIPKALQSLTGFNTIQKK